jgi:hypothetical protein
MELIDRYLQAVKFWLPKNQKQDIIAELSEDLRSQIEDRETELGRPLNESELAEMLKQRGRPVLVANRYRAQQNLIGPVLFPIYLFVLEVVGAFYLVPWILVWITIAIFRPAHPGQGLLATIASFWTAFWPMAFFMVGSITTIFVVLERVQSKSKFMEDWDPRQLPPVRDSNRIPLSSSVTELIANMVFLTWWAVWVGGLWYQTLIHFAGVTITLAPAWRYFFWGYLLVGVGNTVVAAVNVFRPYWTVERAVFRLLSDGIGSGLFCWLTTANILVGLSVVGVAPEKTAQIAHAINWWSAKMFPWAVVFCVLIALSNVYRIIRVRSRPGNGVPLSAATVSH